MTRVLSAGTDSYRESLVLLPTPVMLVAVGQDGTLAYEFANPAWRAACTESSDPRTLRDHLPPAHRPALEEALEGCAATGWSMRVAEFQITPQFENGTVRRIVCSRVPSSRDPNGVRDLSPAAVPPAAVPPAEGSPVTGAPFIGAPFTGPPVTGAPFTGAPSVAGIPAPRDGASPLGTPTVPTQHGRSPSAMLPTGPIPTGAMHHGTTPGSLQPPAPMPPGPMPASLLPHGGGPAQGTSRLSAAQLQTLVDNSPDLITRFDQSGRCLFVNRAAAQVHGKPAEELVGTSVAVAGRHAAGGLDQESARQLAQAIEQVFRTGEPGETELVHDTGVGQVVVQYRLVPETDATGVAASVLAIGRDVSAVRHIEAELDRSRSHYRDVFDNALDQMVLLEVCPKGRFRIVAANPSMLRAMGRREQDVVGRYQDEVLAPDLDRVLTHAYRECMEAGGPTESLIELPLENGSARIQSTLVPTRDVTGRICRLVSICRDVTDLELAERTQRRLNRALQTLSNGNITLIRATDEPSLLDGMCQVMIQVGGYTHAWIGFPSSDPDEVLVPMAAAWKHPQQADPQAWLTHRTVLQDAMTSLTPRISGPSGHHSIPSNHVWDYPADSDLGTTLSLPLHHDGSLIGILVVEAADGEGFRPDEIALLGELAADLSFGIHNLRRLRERDQYEQRLVKAMYATIQALADTTELRDPYTAGHQRRVAQLAEAVGRRMGLSDDRVAGLYLASTIHDIGKISIPAEILSRPGRLSPLEYELMQLHVTAAYDLLKTIEFPWPVAEIVYQHHERFDGSGYPRGISGDDLLLEARILAACDVIEAIASHRPYRPGLGMDAALREMQDGRGTRYDPLVVDACLGLLTTGRFAFS